MSTWKCINCHIKHRTIFPFEELYHEELYHEEQRVKQIERTRELKRKLNIDILKLQFVDLYIQYPKLEQLINLLQKQIEYLEYK